MVLTKKVDVKINNINIKHYNKKYPYIKLNDIININVNELSHGSKYKIDVKCDKCGIIKNMLYSSYYRYAIKNNKNGIYYCNKCVKSERTKNTMIKKYGVEYPLQNNNIKNKFLKTNLEKYGVEYPLQNKLILKKQENTNLKKYGVKCVSLNNDIRKKQTINKIKNLIPKYTDFIFKSYDNENKLIKLSCKYGHNFFISRNNLYNRYTYNTLLCTKCNPINKNISGLEIELINFIKKNYNDEIISNSNIIPPYELDIYLPDLNLAFEFNGVYWHNELYKSNDYHKIKTDLCEKKGIQLIHIYEDDWVYKKDIIKSMILNELNKSKYKIFASKTKIKEIKDNELIRNFLEKNHIQGFAGSKVKLGLFFNNELISLMTFGKLRKNMNSKTINENDYKMLRFCNKLNTNVIGGSSKLFKYFIRNYNPESIISYADRSYSNGNLYKQLGFELIDISKPNYYYIIDRKKEFKFKYKKDILIKQGYDKNKTEHEIMLERKIYRIYNSGNYKFKYLDI